MANEISTHVKCKGSHIKLVQSSFFFFSFLSDDSFFTYYEAKQSFLVPIYSLINSSIPTCGPVFSLHFYIHLSHSFIFVLLLFSSVRPLYNLLYFTIFSDCAINLILYIWWFCSWQVITVGSCCDGDDFLSSFTKFQDKNPYKFQGNIGSAVWQ